MFLNLVMAQERHSGLSNFVLFHFREMSELMQNMSRDAQAKILTVRCLPSDALTLFRHCTLARYSSSLMLLLQSKWDCQKFHVLIHFLLTYLQTPSTRDVLKDGVTSAPGVVETEFLHIYRHQFPPFLGHLHRCLEIEEG